jgi:hypothetical protein
MQPCQWTLELPLIALHCFTNRLRILSLTLPSIVTPQSNNTCTMTVYDSCLLARGLYAERSDILCEQAFHMLSMSH